MDNAIEADSETKMDEMREEVDESPVDRDVDQEALEEKEEEEEEEAALDLYGTLPPDPEDNDNEDETKDRVDYEEEGNEGITTESAEASGINCNGDNDLRPPMPSDSIQCPSTAPPALSSVPPPPSSSSSSSNERTPRYFVLKATSMADIISSKTHELWRVSSEPLFQKLSSAMQSSPEVIVFFTITGMRFYQGYGALRVVSEEEVKAKTFQEAIPLNPSPSENAADRLGASSALEGTAAPPVNNMNASASMMLGVAWKRCGLLSYDKAETVLNAFDKNRRVSAALDGQEVSPEAALRMMELLNECEEEEDVNALDEKMNKAMAERKSRSESVDDPLKTDIKRRRG